MVVSKIIDDDIKACMENKQVSFDAAKKEVELRVEVVAGDIPNYFSNTFKVDTMIICKLELMMKKIVSNNTMIPEEHTHDVGEVQVTVTMLLDKIQGYFLHDLTDDKDRGDLLTSYLEQTTYGYVGWELYYPAPNGEECRIPTTLEISFIKPTE